jgi:hypothetical protein
MFDTQECYDLTAIDWGAIDLLREQQATVRALVTEALHITKEEAAWPPSAVYGASTSTKCWPCSWDESTWTYFETRNELDEFIASYRQWGRLEDNYFRITVYKWDLGPNATGEVHTNS